MSNSVTLNGLPVCIDWQFNLRNFLEARLPSEDILFSRSHSKPLVNPLSCGNADDYLTPPYPALPPLRVGELQWPTGASRYGRALYAVDWVTMRAIAEFCWGYVVPLDGDGNEVPPSDVPAAWGIAANPMVLLINGEGAGTFTASMRPLAPYRVTGQGIDLWLLPLVDARYFNLPTTQSPSAYDDWVGLIGALYTTTQIDAVPTAYTTPNARLTSTKLNQPKASLFDCASLSVGLRAVFDPALNQCRVLNQENSRRRRDATLGFTVNPTTGVSTGSTSPLLIAGGKRGISDLPSSLKVHCLADGNESTQTGTISGGTGALPAVEAYSTWEDLPDEPTPPTPDGKVGSPYSYSTTAGGSGSHTATGLPPGLTINSTTGIITGTPTTAGTFTVVIHRGATDTTLTIKIVGLNSAKTTAFVNQVASDVSAWSNSGAQYCFAGTFNYLPSGYDDFCSVEISELQPGEYVFRTRIYELPAVFLPRVILAGGVASDCDAAIMFRFEMTEDMDPITGETPKSTIIRNFPKDVTYTSEAILCDVDKEIEFSRAGFTGQCYKEAGKYWFMQGPCALICKSNTSIPGQTPLNARVGQTDYAWTPTSIGTVTASSWSATGLPTGWAINASTGQITGPTTGGGVLGPEGTVDIVIKCTGPKISPATGTCNVTRKITIKKVGA